MYPLSEKVNEIRNFIEFETARKEHSLRQDMTKWLMLGSCMHTIEITEKGLESFLTEGADSDGMGKNYLRISGALQILVTQQEAVKNLHTALGIKLPKDSSMKKVVKNINRMKCHRLFRPQFRKVNPSFVARIP